MKKIVIAGLMMDTNLGEELYPHCLKYLLLESADFEINFRDLDFYGRAVRCELNTAREKRKELTGTQNLNFFQKSVIKFVNGICYRINQKERAKHVVWTLNPNNRDRLYAYYAECLKDADLLVFGGGGIIECSSNHDYHHYVGTILEIADEKNIPTVFNSVGLVVDKRHMLGWNIMKQALNRSCVKAMTCRDGTDWINQNLYDGRIFASELPCSAIFASEAYHIAKDTTSRIIGIGLIRGSIFTSYGNPVSQDNLLDLYEQIVRKVLEMGYDCCIFTNGYSQDIQFGQLLAERLSKSEHISYALQPENGEELVRTIASFKAMITARLHSIITAYSLNVPAVGITWTAKVSDFLNLVGRPENAVPMEKLNADNIITALEQAMQKGYDLEHRNALKKRIRNKVAEMLTYLE